MIRWILFFVCFSCFNRVLGQRNNFVDEVAQISTFNATAKLHKFKSISIYKLNSEQKKKGSFVRKAYYNAQGLLLHSREFTSQKEGFVDAAYAYDSANRLILVCKEYSNKVLDTSITRINYVDSVSSTIASIEFYFGEKKSIVFDKLSFVNDSTNACTYRIWRDRTRDVDTIFYLNTSQSEIWFESKKEMIDSNNYRLDSKGCLVKLKHRWEIREWERDSLCRIKAWKHIVKYDAHWILMEEGKNSYSNLGLQETTVFACDKFFILNCGKQLSLQSTTNYKYNEKGLPLEIRFYRSNSKLKRILKCTYEYY